MSEMFPPPLLMGNFLGGKWRSHLILFFEDCKLSRNIKKNQTWTKKKNNLRERAEESCLGWESSLRKWSISRRAITWASPCIDKAFFVCGVSFLSFWVLAPSNIDQSSTARSLTHRESYEITTAGARRYIRSSSLTPLPFKLHVLLLFLFSRSCTAGISQSVDERRCLLVQYIISLFGFFFLLKFYRSVYKKSYCSSWILEFWYRIVSTWLSQF